MSNWEAGVYELMIQENHLDSFGHVNNAVYLEIFEEARWDLITRNGYGYRQVQELQKGPTILEITLQFKRELRLRERVRVETKILSYSGKVGELQQDIKSLDGQTVHSTAVFKFGLFDMKTRRLIEATPEWLKGIGHVGGER